MAFRLNLASGPHELDGFQNLDLQTGWRFQDGLLDYPDESVEGITESHGLLYLPLSDWPFFFSEIARVLEPGGVVRITEDSTDDPKSERYGGFHDAVTLTSEHLVRTYLQVAGLTPVAVDSAETHFGDDSLIQANHGTVPKVFFIEGLKE